MAGTRAVPRPQPAPLTQVASPQVASEKYEEGERALREARQVQSEQQARLQLVQEQQERLRQQERHLHQVRPLPAPAPPTDCTPPPVSHPHSRVLFSGDGGQEHLSMAQQRLQLDRVRQDLTTGPMGLLTRAPGLAASGMNGKWLQRMVLWPPGRAVHEHPAYASLLSG